MDASEIKIEIPTRVDQSILAYSSYKSSHTLKFLISVSPGGLVTFISKCYGGRVTDGHITTESGFLELITPGDVILADKVMYESTLES